MNTIWLGLKLARRELRGGTRGLRIVLACLALGVASIAAVGSLRAAIQAGLQADGARLLGGDFEIRGGYQPVPPEPIAWAVARGAVPSTILLTRAMLVALRSDRREARRLLVGRRALARPQGQQWLRSGSSAQRDQVAPARGGAQYVRPWNSRGRCHARRLRR